MSDMLTENDTSPVAPPSVDEDTIPPASTTDQKTPTADTLSPEESTASSTQDDSSQDGTDALDDTLIEMPAVPSSSAEGEPHVAESAPTRTRLLPRFIASIRHPRSKKSLIFHLLLLALLLAALFVPAIMAFDYGMNA